VTAGRAAIVCALAGVVAAVAAGCGSAPSAQSSAPSFEPMPDPASMQQVILPAREFVILNRLQDVIGTFGWVDCGGQDGPLYSGEVHLSFLFPGGVGEDRYLAQMQKMMVSHGWLDTPLKEGAPAGTVLHTNEVRAEITGPSSDDSERGTIRLSGECRNTTDHREHSAEIDITEQLTNQR
jgi:hypothetical protein